MSVKHTVKHPAKFSPELLPVLARYVDGARTILDPFAGTGRVGLLRQHLGIIPLIHANELEAEWAAEAGANGCDFVRIGDARDLDCNPETFDAIVTSPAYGNRMADAANWAEGRRHSTYTSALRETTGDPNRSLSPGNAGAMQWGDSYRALHREAWAEAWRVLVPGGRLVVNVADHYRDGRLQGVPEWHTSALLGIGFVLLDWTEVDTPRYGFGANAELRAPELVIVFEKPNPGVALGHAPSPPFVRRADESWEPCEPGPSGLDLWAVEPEPQQLKLL